MSANLLYNLSDENPNLHKQIGCMNGILQVFYRQHYPARPVIDDHDLPGETSDRVDEDNLAMDKNTEKKIKRKATKEKQRVSIESSSSLSSSSRLSFSSSPSPRSSNFSSPDVNKASQYEPLNAIKASSNRSSPRTANLIQCDLRELVKGSIHSEGRRAGHVKDSPRFSYDERSNGYKTAITKPRETPRLSLDSRSNSFTSSRTDTRSYYLPEDGTHRRTTSTVVAKLMGLDVDVLPDTTVIDHDCLSRASVMADKNRQNRFCDSPRPSRSVDSVKKMMTPASIFPMEPAPWKQVESTTKGRTKGADSSLTVYGEIQKRLTQLEFKKSGKDLRALKQILEAMEKTQQLIDGRKDSTMLTSNRSTLVQATPAVAMATSPSKNFRSSIVVMKPASTDSTSVLSQNVALPNLRVGKSRHIRKGMNGNQTATDLTPRPGLYKGQLDSPVKKTNSRPSQSNQTSAESCSMKSDTTKSGRSQHNVGLRFQQKKLGSERQYQLATSTSEAGKIQRQHGRQQTESASPRRKYRTKSRNLPQSDDQLSDASSDLRSLSHQSEPRSLRSDSNISSVSNADTEVTSRYRLERPCDISEQHTSKQRSPEYGFKQNKPLLKPVKVTPEQPSPVSVLDAAFYEDESPSPVKKISVVFKEDDILSVEEAEWIKEETNQSPLGFRRSMLLPENNQRLTNGESGLVECLMDEVEVSCDLENTDHKYILEILLASGLLRDLEYSMISIQLHQSSLPINPNLFFVLEQNKAGDVLLQDRYRGKGIGQTNQIEKIKRKLVFDTVNDILVQRFVAEGCAKPHIKSSLITEKRPRGKYLLKTLCSEIDRLQANNSKCSLDDDEDIKWEDLQNQGMNWRDFEGETPAIVLDIERMIFKDLINEVVTGNVTTVQRRFKGQPRQLFPC